VLRGCEQNCLPKGHLLWGLSNPFAAMDSHALICYAGRRGGLPTRLQTFGLGDGTALAWVCARTSRYCLCKGLALQGDYHTTTIRLGHHRIRILTDFRKMNQAIERKPSPLPRIGETIQ